MVLGNWLGIHCYAISEGSTIKTQWRIQDFPGDANSGGRGGGYANLLFCKIVAENYMKSERIWTKGGCVSLVASLDPPLNPLLLCQ